MDRIRWKIAIQKVFPKGRSWICLARAVVGNKKTDSGIREEVQVTMEIVEITPMSNNAEPIAVLFIKAERHAIDGRVHRELARVHELRSLRLQNAFTFILSILQVGGHEVRYFNPRHRQAAIGGGLGGQEFEGFRPLRSQSIAFRHQRF